MPHVLSSPRHSWLGKRTENPTDRATVTRLRRNPLQSAKFQGASPPRRKTPVFLDQNPCSVSWNVFAHRKCTCKAVEGSRNRKTTFCPQRRRVIRSIYAFREGR